MDGGAGQSTCPFTREVERWKQLNLPELMPVDVVETRLVLGLCDRWHKLPSEVLAEDAYDLLHLLMIERLAKREDA